MSDNKPSNDDFEYFHSLDCVTFIIDGQRTYIIPPIPRSRWHQVMTERDPFDMQTEPDQPQE